MNQFSDGNTDKSVLKKELGLLSVFSIAAGAMISSGLFVLLSRRKRII